MGTNHGSHRRKRDPAMKLNCQVSGPCLQFMVGSDLVSNKLTASDAYFAPSLYVIAVKYHHLADVKDFHASSEGCVVVVRFLTLF